MLPSLKGCSQCWSRPVLRSAPGPHRFLPLSPRLFNWLLPNLSRWRFCHHCQALDFRPPSLLHLHPELLGSFGHAGPGVFLCTSSFRGLPCILPLHLIDSSCRGGPPWLLQPLDRTLADSVFGSFSALSACVANSSLDFVVAPARFFHSEQSFVRTIPSACRYCVFPFLFRISTGLLGPIFLSLVGCFGRCPLSPSPASWPVQLFFGRSCLAVRARGVFTRFVAPCSSLTICLLSPPAPPAVLVRRVPSLLTSLSISLRPPCARSPSGRLRFYVLASSRVFPGSHSPTFLFCIWLFSRPFLNSVSQDRR